MKAWFRDRWNAINDEPTLLEVMLTLIILILVFK